MSYKVNVTQKKYFFDSITDWVRWNYFDGKVDYTEGVNAFTLEELGATTISTKIDNVSTTVITGFTNTDLFAKTKVIIIRDVDKLTGTNSVAWGVKTTDNKCRFICQRQTKTSKFPILMSNYSYSIDFGTRVPLMFSESNMPYYGKSFLRNPTPSTLVLPNIDSNCTKLNDGNGNVYRHNSSIQMNDVIIDQGIYTIGSTDFQEESNKNPLILNCTINQDCSMYTDINVIKKIITNGLLPITTTRTLTLGSTLLAQLTDKEKKLATDKGWTLA